MTTTTRFIDESIGRYKLREVTFSGTVSLDNNIKVERRILLWNMSKLENDIAPLVTWSDSNGLWSFTVLGAGSNDRFMIVVVGEDGENSEIFSNLSG